MKRKQYTTEFKIEAVRRKLAGERPKALAQALGIHPSMVSNWCRQLAPNGALVTGKKPATTNGSRPPVKKQKQRRAPSKHDDAMVFLRHSRDELIKGIRSGRIVELDKSHALALLALHTLDGE